MDSAHSESVTQTWPPGAAILFERYQVLGILGQGGMGTVYKGYHLSLKRYVAIKVLRIDQIPNSDLVSRFLREMEAVGRMDHPNVVRAADAGKKNGVFYLVMEYLNGSDLSRLVSQRGPLRPADACELARQTAVGLDYIHQTLVHRDVKPSNLVLTTAGLVKILDLGLARLHEVTAGEGEHTPTGSALGTYDYMAPEQAVASSRVDARADIYSLGCTLFKLLTGRPPFAAPDYSAPAQKLYAHAHVPLSASPDFAAIPEGLRPVLLRMTAKDPAERYAAAREVAEALASFAAEASPLRLLDGSERSTAPLLPLPSRPPEEIERLTASANETPVHIAGVPELRTPAPARRPRRRLPLVAASALLACALALGVWLCVRGWPPQPAPPPTSPASLEPDEVRLPPPPGPLIAVDALSRFNWHNLLGPGQPPTLVGYREGGETSGRWMPGRQQIEINPADTVLIQLAADDRQVPAFAFDILLNQRPWSGGIGLFWGYQEDTGARTGPQPGRPFARCQTLLLFSGPRPNGGAERFFIQRAATQLSYSADGDIVLGQKECSQDFLLPFRGEQLVQIVVEGGQLKSARFGEVDLASAYQPDANRKFQPADYRGAFGVYSHAASVTLRQPRVMPRPVH